MKYNKTWKTKLNVVLGPSIKSNKHLKFFRNLNNFKGYFILGKQICLAQNARSRDTKFAVTREAQPERPKRVTLRVDWKPTLTRTVTFDPFTFPFKLQR